MHIGSSILRASALVSLIAAVGCTSTAAAPGTGAPVPDGGAPDSGSARTPDASRSATDGSAPPVDAASHMDGGGGPAPVLLEDVSGRFVDPNGDPPPEGFGASVCGPVCYISQTDATGDFTVSIGDVVDLAAYSTLPHGRPLIAGFYFALPEDAPGPHIALGDLPLIPMPEDGPSITLTGGAAQTLTSGPATLLVDAGVKTLLEFDDVAAGDSGKKFRAVQVDPSIMGRYVPAGMSAVFALGPFESSETSGGTPVLTRLRFDNTADLPAGTRVEYLALGTYLHPDWIPPGHFSKVATGAVSADGKSLALDDGQGFQYLTWVAVRTVEAP